MNAIKKLFAEIYLKTLKPARKCSMHCNHGDNYYGDQLCVLEELGRNVR